MDGRLDGGRLPLGRPRAVPGLGGEPPAPEASHRPPPRTERFGAVACGSRRAPLSGNSEKIQIYRQR